MMEGIGDLERRTFIQIGLSPVAAAVGRQVALSAFSGDAETRDSLLLKLVGYVMTNAPDLSSIPENSKYGYENGILRFTDKFPAYGHNFEFSIAFSSLAVDYIENARRLSLRNPSAPMTPVQLMIDMGGNFRLDGLVQEINLFADNFYLRDEGGRGVTLLEMFEKPYSLETANNNNPRILERDISNPKYRFLKKPANEFEAAILKAIKAHLMGADSMDGANLTLAPMNDYAQKLENLGKALGVPGLPTT